MDLQTLIIERKGRRSYEDLARAAGGNPTAARLQQIATNPAPMRSFPSLDTLRALHRALRVPLRTVVEAAAESCGLDISGPRSRLEQWLPGDLDRLTPAQVDAVLAVIAAMLDPGEVRITEADAETVMTDSGLPTEGATPPPPGRPGSGPS